MREAVPAAKSNRSSSIYRLRLTDGRAADDRRRLRNLVSEALQQGKRRVIVDCEEMSDLDLMLLSALLTCATTCTSHAAQFELANLRSDLRSRIEALQLASSLGIGGRDVARHAAS